MTALGFDATCRVEESGVVPPHSTPLVALWLRRVVMSSLTLPPITTTPERGSVTRSRPDEAKRKRMESEHVETESLLRLAEPRSDSRPVWWWCRTA